MARNYDKEKLCKRCGNVLSWTWNEGLEKSKPVCVWCADMKEREAFIKTCLAGSALSKVRLWLQLRNREA